MFLNSWGLGVFVDLWNFCTLCVTELNPLSVPTILTTALILLLLYVCWKTTELRRDYDIIIQPNSRLQFHAAHRRDVGELTVDEVRLIYNQPYLPRFPNETQRRETTQPQSTSNSNIPAGSRSLGVLLRLWLQPLRGRTSTLAATRPLRTFLRSRLHPPFLWTYQSFFSRHHRSRNSIRSNILSSPQLNSGTLGNHTDNDLNSGRSSADTSSADRVPQTTENSEIHPNHTGNRDLINCDISEIQENSSGTPISDRKEEVDMESSTPPVGAEIKFTIKFLDDTQLEVVTTENEKVGNFKRRHFARELSENKIIRLIFNGRVLQNDNRTLKDSGIFEQCVVHCLIITPQQQDPQASGTTVRSPGANGGTTGPNVPRVNGTGPEPGVFFVSLMGVILIMLWFICFNFGQQLFTQSAVVSLSVLTGIFLIGLVAFYLPVHPTGTQPNHRS